MDSDEALMKEREDRYQTAREVLIDLRRFKQRMDVAFELERSAMPTADTTKSAPKESEPQESRATSEVVPQARETAARWRSHVRGLIVWPTRNKVKAIIGLTVLATVLVAIVVGVQKLSRTTNEKQDQSSSEAVRC